ncbi:malonyl CoA-acyl carrier protein transacylase [mine drainage metagenome]|uniref:[acyl-carrier-protein] S-malonyltransferase n=1 Tax=mine drainage metagenome TaxID=410659 RepID=A0A1J5PQ83_9ZZZZ
MAAVIGLDDNVVEESIQTLMNNSGEKIFIANYNGPGQLVLSGSKQGIKEACRLFKSMGAKRAVVLPIEGAFHTPLMNEVELKYRKSIQDISFKTPIIPICQCADSKINFESEFVKLNLMSHMTSSVNWTKMVNRLVNFGVTEFIEIGTDDTLQKIVRRMYPDLKVSSILQIETYKGLIRDYSL